MTRSSSDGPSAVRPALQSSIEPGHRHGPETNTSDEPARSPTARLLLDAQNAAALGHKLALLDIEAKDRTAWHRSHFNPNQPRVPAGHPDGGQWTTSGGGAGASDPRVVSDVTPDNAWKPGARYATDARRGPARVRVGKQWLQIEGGQANRLAEAEARAQAAIARVRELDPSWRPRPSAYESVEGLIRTREAEAEQAQARFRELASVAISSQIPKQRPPTPQERHDIAREIARALVKHGGHLVEGASWILEYESSIDAYLDPPKSLDELRQAVSTPKKGYDLHHIVEQTSAKEDGFPNSMINGPDNLVRIPRFKHWEITAWSMTKNENYNGLSPRDYLRGQDWGERTRVGLEALMRHGVLKP
jgi:hypothetical protein